MGHGERFNLVIEVLFFSSSKERYTTARKAMFQSRNRGSFLFKQGQGETENVRQRRFQSRNRGSFLFKSLVFFPNSTSEHLFQSRNRGSFLFKKYHQHFRA